MHNYIKLSVLSLISLAALSACNGGSGSNGGSSTTPNNLISNFVDTNDNFKLVIYDVSDTVFAGKIYNPKFILKNNSTQAITIGNFNVTMSEPAIWNQAATNCPSIPAGGTCTVTGTFSLANPSTNAIISIALNGTDGTPIYTHTQNVVAIAPAPEGYLAIRINYPSGGNQKVYAAALLSGKMVQFDNNTHYGTITTDSVDGPLSYKTHAIEIAGSPTDSNVLYLPPGDSGRIYISLDNTLSDGPAPSLTGSDKNNRDTLWQPVEFFSAGTKALSNINATNVDQVSVPVELSLVISGEVAGETSGYAARTTANYDMQSIPMTKVLSDIANDLETKYPNSWGKLVYRNESGQIIRILAASQTVNRWDEPGFFSTEDYTKYVDDLWDFYRTHDLYVDASAISAGVPGHQGAACTVKGRVGTDDKLHFVPLNTDKGDCPENLATGHIESETFTKFTAGDFIEGASGAQYTTWGPNRSYRSVIGQNIVSAQSVGLLPFCNEPDTIYGKEAFVNYDSLFYTPQYSCLGNYSLYTDRVVNQYMQQSAKYFNYYNYAYGDSLGKDGALYDLDIALYPMTVTIGKMK